VASAGSRRAAVLVPGGAYTVDGPLLMYAGLAVERREGYAHRISWTPPKSLATSHAVGPRASHRRVGHCHRCCQAPVALSQPRPCCLPRDLAAGNASPRRQLDWPWT